MKVPQLSTIQTAGDARELAIDWQGWQSDKHLSWGDMVDWQILFETLADKFDLRDEFSENGII